MLHEIPLQMIFSFFIEFILGLMIFRLALLILLCNHKIAKIRLALRLSFAKSGQTAVTTVHDFHKRGRENLGKI